MFSFQFIWLSKIQSLEFSPVRIWVAEQTRSILGVVTSRNPVLCHQGHLEMRHPPLPGTHLAASPRSAWDKGQFTSRAKIILALKEHGVFKDYCQGIHETASIS